MLKIISSWIEESQDELMHSDLLLSKILNSKEIFKKDKNFKNYLNMFWRKKAKHYRFN